MLNPIRVLIVDDQHLFAESLKFVLDGESNGRVEVTGIAGNGKEAIAQLSADRPDVMLLDIRMPVMDGVETTARVHASHPDIKIIILTTFDDDELAVSALSHGASGYVLKDVDPPDLIRCIEAVYKGAYFISPSVGIRLFDTMGTESRHGGIDREQMIVGYLKEIPALSRREGEILYFVVRAQSNKSIADKLYISEKTVKNHLSSIYTKLDVHNRLQLIHKILQMSEDVLKNMPPI